MFSAVSLRPSFYLHDCRNDRVRKNNKQQATMQQASETIYPPPERIACCYSQCQPAYTEMLVGVIWESTRQIAKLDSRQQMYPG